MLNVCETLTSTALTSIAVNGTDRIASAGLLPVVVPAVVPVVELFGGAQVPSGGAQRLQVLSACLLSLVLAQDHVKSWGG